MQRTTTHHVVVPAQQARRIGLDVAALLAEAGISADLPEAEDQWLGNDRFASLVQALWNL